ncbi:hypothetical protein FOA52_012316 [Chlamydomonas sp. UWO 241]|nr:hypothetical protein FOA52_012316 [Chlamydomonas sp. UWO 241]
MDSHSCGNLARVLVLDEADLLLSYGYEDDLTLIAQQVPRSCQCMLMSATSSDDIERLTKLVLHSPVTLNLLASGGSDGGLAAGSGSASEIEHFLYDCAPADRLLATMALLKLGLVKKKALIFVNSVDRGYQLRLFLESFGVRTALLNAELPINSRSHILATFNKGMFDFLIATDDVHAAAHDAGKGQAQGKRKRGKDAEKPQLGKDGRRGGKAKKDEEFGVTRGIDFKGVRTIINYDLPSTVQGYVHRVGRTGRAGQAGVAITLFTPADAEFKAEVMEALEDARESAAGPDPDAMPVRVHSESEDEDDEGGVAARARAEALTAARAEAERRAPLRPFGRLPQAQAQVCVWGVRVCV